LGGATAMWPHVLEAQQGAIPVVGFVSNTAAETNSLSLKAFRDGLAVNGFGRLFCMDQLRAWAGKAPAALVR